MASCIPTGKLQGSENSGKLTKASINSSQPKPSRKKKQNKNIQFLNKRTFHVIIDKTLMAPSVEPNATKGPSPPDDLVRNSMLQRKE